MFLASILTFPVLCLLLTPTLSFKLVINGSPSDTSHVSYWHQSGVSFLTHLFKWVSFWHISYVCLLQTTTCLIVSFLVSLNDTSPMCLPQTPTWCFRRATTHVTGSLLPQFFTHWHSFVIQRRRIEFNQKKRTLCFSTSLKFWKGPISGSGRYWKGHLT